MNKSPRLLATLAKFKLVMRLVAAVFALALVLVLSPSVPPQALRPTLPSKAAVTLPPVPRKKPRRFKRAAASCRKCGPPPGLVTAFSCVSIKAFRWLRESGLRAFKSCSLGVNVKVIKSASPAG